MGTHVQPDGVRKMPQNAAKLALHTVVVVVQAVESARVSVQARTYVQ